MAPPPRSYLFVPGHSERHLARASHWGADALVLDLEDAVPLEKKDRARELIQKSLATHDDARQPSPLHWVRINSLASKQWREDIRAVVRPGIAGLRIPKVHSAAILHELEDTLRPAEERAGLPTGSTRLTCSIESAAGLMEARAIASAPRVSYLAFGAADFAADIGWSVKESGLGTLLAQAFLVVCARAAGLASPIAAPYLRLRDAEGLREYAQRARAYGFFGQSVLHPRQIGVVHSVFTPTSEEVEWAQETCSRYDQALSAGEASALTADGEFIGKPTVLRARKLLEFAAASVMEAKTADDREHTS